MRCMSYWLSISCLLWGSGSALAADNLRITAAAYTRTVATDLEFDDGSAGELTTRRYGVEYWEEISAGIHGGFVVGYSGSELRAGGLLQETAAGNYAGLRFRFIQPLSTHFDLAGSVDALYQRDARSIDDSDYRFRTIENSAELGLRYHSGAFFLGAGGSWRRMDFLQEEEGGAGLASAQATESPGSFAEIGLFADRGGSIAFRWEAGASEGWTLRYQREF